MSSIVRNLRNLFVATCALSAAAFPVLASDPAEIVNRGVESFNQAVEDENAGRYADACIGYRDAAERFESAIYSLLGQPMQTEDEREGVKAYADHIQDYVDKAKANANAVCSK